MRKPTLAAASTLMILAAAIPHAQAQQQVIDTAHAGKRRLRLRDYQVEATSGSGRWLVLGGDVEEGDYIYRRLVLLDRQDGTLYPLGEEPGPWPKPIGRVGQAARTVGTPVAQAALVPYEDELRWLQGGSGDLLVFGRLIVLPGKPSFAVDGEVAR